MLAFLEVLCAALTARDAVLIRRLLRNPLADALPRAVREEASAIAAGHVRGFVAPLNALRLYHQTAQLLGAKPSATVPRRPGDGAASRGQPELDFEVMAVR